MVRRQLPPGSFNGSAEIRFDSSIRAVRRKKPKVACMLGQSTKSRGKGPTTRSLGKVHEEEAQGPQYSTIDRPVRRCDAGGRDDHLDGVAEARVLLDDGLAAVRLLVRAGEEEAVDEADDDDGPLAADCGWRGIGAEGGKRRGRTWQKRRKGAQCVSELACGGISEGSEGSLVAQRPGRYLG